MMNLFLVLNLLFLVGAALAQVSKEDFVVLNDGTYADDLDLGQMDQLEANGTMKAHVAELLKFDSASSLRRACSNSSGCPQVYLQALDSGLRIFGSDSSTNSLDNTTNPEDNTTRPSESTPLNQTTTPLSPMTTPQTQRTTPQTPSTTTRTLFTTQPGTLINYCQHTNKLLKFVWFTATAEVCFVPFPWAQSLTFAECQPQIQCWRTPFERFPSGTCRPSCYARRKVFVMCTRIGWPFVNFWYSNWKWILVNLPQSCECSAY